MSVATQEALKAFYLVTLTLSAFACISLLLSPRGERRIKVALLLLCLVISLLPFNAYLMLAFKQSSSLLIYISATITWLYGPIVYFALREISLRPLSYKQLALHLVPFVAVIAVQIFMLPEHNIYKPRALGLDFYHYLFIQVFAYLGLCLYWLYNNASIATRAIKHYKNSTFYWFAYLVIFLSGLMLYDLLLINQLRAGASFDTALITTISSVMCIFVCSISLFALYQPAIFDYLSTANNEDDVTSEAGDFNQHTQPIELRKVELRQVELSTEASAELQNRLAELVTQHQLHLDPDLSMRKLSALLGITTHQLSELLNVHMETSFYEYFNLLRHEAAKTLITKHQSLSINDIAYQSGFNNRNSFYKVFKEHTGMTPANYRKTQLAK
ncbi:helix-turn-helix domain-containing protein [Alteromonadaceae bacterium BrNp21-10]|nr:helix-turn-helix domain-containing protein [Alteromonadaceae bacterium BrNp21-10]